MADTTLTHDLELQDSPTTKQPKIIYAGDQFDGQPYVVVLEDDIVLFGDANNIIAVNPQFGVQLAGKISLAATPDEISIAGYWTLDPRHLSTVPSTTPTPIPLLAKSTPRLLRASKGLAKALSYMEGLG